MISRSGVVISITNCYIRVYFTYLQKSIQVSGFLRSAECMGVLLWSACFTTECLHLVAFKFSNSTATLISCSVVTGMVALVVQGFRKKIGFEGSKI